MGKKRQAKLWKRALQAAEAHELAKAKHPCSTCAFTDAECFVSNPSIGRKILACLQSGTYFWCHDGMPLGGPEGTSYQPPLRPDGQVDTGQMEPCGGFIRFAARVRTLPRHTQEQEILKLQKRAIVRFLESPQCYPELRGQRVEDVQFAINLDAYLEHGESNGEEML